MPQFGPDIRAATFSSANDLALLDDYIVLRKRTATTGVYNPFGTMAATATVTFPAMVMPGLIELFGFEELAEYALDSAGAKLGAIDYQISTDNGTTYYYWTGSVWATATTQYSSAQAIETNIGTLTLSPTRKIIIKARLSSDATNKYGPKFYGISLKCEIRHRPFEDALRSIHSYFTANLSASLANQQRLAAAATTLTLGTSATVIAVDMVFNLTTDPIRGTNLYSSYAPTTKTVTLTGIQATGSVLEIQFRAKVQVNVSEAEDELVTAAIPALRIVVNGYDRADEWSQRLDIDRVRYRLIARTRRAPDFYNLDLTIAAIADRDDDSLNIIKAVETLLDETECPYLPTGEPLKLIDFRAVDDSDVVGEGRFVKIANAVFQLREWTETYVQVPLVQTVNIQVGGTADNAPETVVINEDDL